MYHLGFVLFVVIPSFYELLHRYVSVLSLSYHSSDFFFFLFLASGRRRNLTSGKCSCRYLMAVMQPVACSDSPRECHARHPPAWPHSWRCAPAQHCHRYVCWEPTSVAIFCVVLRTMCHPTNTWLSRPFFRPAIASNGPWCVDLSVIYQYNSCILFY